jgi:hypothetical protein
VSDNELSPWITPALARRAAIRALAVAAVFVAAHATMGVDLALGVTLGLACGALAVLEPWVARAPSPRSRAARIVLGYLLAGIAYGAAFLDSVYFEAAWEGRSAASGFSALASDASHILGSPLGVQVLFFAEVFAIACATVTAWRGVHVGQALLFFFAVVPFTGFADTAVFLVWTLGFQEHTINAQIVAKDAVAILIEGSLALGIFGGVGALALAGVAWVCDRVDARLWPAKPE